MNAEHGDSFDSPSRTNPCAGPLLPDLQPGRPSPADDLGADSFDDFALDSWGGSSPRNNAFKYAQYDSSPYESVDCSCNGTLLQSVVTIHPSPSCTRHPLADSSGAQSSPPLSTSYFASPVWEAVPGSDCQDGDVSRWEELSARPFAVACFAIATLFAAWQMLLSKSVSSSVQLVYTVLRLCSTIILLVLRSPFQLAVLWLSAVAQTLVILYHVAIILTLQIYLLTIRFASVAWQSWLRRHPRASSLAERSHILRR